MKKLLIVFLLFVSCAHYKDYTPVDYSRADSIKIVQIQPVIPDTGDVQIRIGPSPRVIQGPSSPNISWLRTQFRDQLEDMNLPNHPIPVDSLDSVLQSIQNALNLASSHMSEELRLRRRNSTVFISVNSDAIVFTFRSLSNWFGQQGCVRYASLPEYEDVAHPHIMGQTSMPLQIPVSVTLSVEPDNIDTHQFSMLLENEPSFEFLPGM